MLKRTEGIAFVLTKAARIIKSSAPWLALVQLRALNRRAMAEDARTGKILARIMWALEIEEYMLLKSVSKRKVKYGQDDRFDTDFVFWDAQIL